MTATVDAAVDARTAGTLTARAPKPRARYLASFSRWLFIPPAVLSAAVFFGYPVVKNIVMSFQDYTTRTFFTGEAPWVGFANYDTVVHSAVFPKAVANTVLFTVGSILGHFVIGLAIAVYFQRRFP